MKMQLNQQQKMVFSGTVAAAFFSFTFMMLGFQYFPLDLPVMHSFEEKLYFVIRADLFAAIMVMLTMMTVSVQRFTNPRAIDGDAIIDGSSLDINVRVANNTFEQFVLLFISHLAISTYAGGPFLNLIPVSVMWFIVARIAYWIGYHISPAHRAFGWAATFYPTIFYMLYSGARIVEDIFFTTL